MIGIFTMQSYGTKLGKVIFHLKEDACQATSSLNCIIKN